MHSIVNVLHDTGLFTLRWLILDYINFTLIQKKKKEKKKRQKNPTLYFPGFLIGTMRSDSRMLVDKGVGMGGKKKMLVDN